MRSRANNNNEGGEGQRTRERVKMRRRKSERKSEREGALSTAEPILFFLLFDLPTKSPRKNETDGGIGGRLRHQRQV